MPAKTGGSHAIASAVTFVVGTVLSKYIWSVAPPLGEVALTSMTILRSATSLPVPVNDQSAGTMVVMIALSFVWGVVYHFSRH